MSLDTATRIGPGRAMDEASPVAAGGPGELRRHVTPLLMGLVGFYLAVFSAARADATSMGPRGLISILAWPFFLGLFLVLVAVVLELRAPDPASATLLTVIVVIVLFGSAPLAEPVARLSDSWFHEGIASLVNATGTPLPPFDARASWPGGFSLAALVQALGGTTRADAFLRWAPLAFELLYLAPLRVIARSCGVSERAGWIGTLVFYLGNWTEQDYFSPQALNTFFFLTVVATVLAVWQPAAADARRTARNRVLAWVRPPTGPVTTFGRHRTTGLVGVLMVIAAASACSHQLTPYALVLALAACLLTRRLPGPELILGVGVLAMGWLSLGATAFWTGHLNLIFGGLGQVSSSVQANVGNRIVGSVIHQQIVHLRIVFTLLVLLLAGLGVLLRLRQPGRHLEALAAAPFLLLGAQSYGGEGLLRIYLFSLPFLGLLVGVLADRVLGTDSADSADSASLRRLTGQGLTLTALCLAALLLVVTRGGNDSYVAFRATERAGVLDLYQRLPVGSSVGVLATYLPINDQRLADLNLVASDAGEDLTLPQATSLLMQAKPDVIILNCSQEAWGEQVQDWPAGWDRGVDRTARAAGYLPAMTNSCMTVLRRSDVPVLTQAFAGDPVGANDTDSGAGS